MKSERTEIIQAPCIFFRIFRTNEMTRAIHIVKCRRPERNRRRLDRQTVEQTGGLKHRQTGAQIGSQRAKRQGNRQRNGI